MDPQPQTNPHGRHWETPSTPNMHLSLFPKPQSITNAQSISFVLHIISHQRGLKDTSTSFSTRNLRRHPGAPKMAVFTQFCCSRGPQAPYSPFSFTPHTLGDEFLLQFYFTAGKTEDL